MLRHSFDAIYFALVILSTVLESQAAQPFYVPFYGTSANGFQSPPRGFNTFALQAGHSQLQQEAGWTFNDAHIREQCDLIVTQDGGEYVCSVDSGWSMGCNGDANGIFSPDPSVIPNVTDLADHLHSKGLKFGLYILPGAFSGDASKTVAGTNIQLGSLFEEQPQYNCRQGFDYGKDGVQQFHDSVVKTFVDWGVDFIKLDYMTPGSPDPGDETLPANSSGAAIAYHNAIKSLGVSMRLDISWKLVRSDPYWQIWRSTSDSLRVDQDTNNQGQNTLASWQTVLRTLDFFRQFINEQTVSSRQGQSIQIHPDLDNTFIGNAPSFSGLSNVQRYSQAIHWIGAGGNIITGSDLTHLDSLGTELLWNTEAMGVADFTAQYPMQPRNPEGSKTVGGNAAEQLQAWIAGPDSSGKAVVVLANYGPDPCLHSSCATTYGTSLQGTQLVQIELTDLGIGGSSWAVRRVWGGGGQGGPDHTDLGVTSTQMGSNLGPGESALYVLTKQ